MSDFPILLADAEMWIKIVGGIIVMLIYLVNHLTQAAGKGQKRPQARPEARPDPRARPRPVPGRQDVQDEVAEFLKRAAEKRTGTRPAEQPPQPQRRSMPRVAAQPEIVEARAVEEPPSRRWPDPVHSQVDTRTLAERADQLAHADRGDAAFQAHMQVFDHQVGRFNESVPQASAEATHAGGLAEGTGMSLSDVFARLLADPQNLRQVIVLNEIMERPVERW